MKKLALYFLLSAFAGQTSFAGDSTRKVQFRTICVEQIEGLEKVLVPTAKNSSKTQEITLFTDISPPVSGGFANNEALFYAMRPGPDGKPARVVVGKAALGKSNVQLFVFVPNGDGEGKLPYQVRAYDDDSKSFAVGTIRAINLATVPVRFVMSEGPTAPVLPDTFGQFPQSKAVNDYNLYSVTVEFQEAGGEWVTLQTANWRASDKNRDFVILSENQKTKERKIQMFSDTPPKASK